MPLDERKEKARLSKTPCARRSRMAKARVYTVTATERQADVRSLAGSGVVLGRKHSGRSAKAGKEIRRTRHATPTSGDAKEPPLVPLRQQRMRQQASL